MTYIKTIITILSILFFINNSIASQSNNIIKETKTIKLDIASSDTDIFYKESKQKLPVVIVAHGFSRSKDNMTGWGDFLAAKGYFVVIPDLPYWSNHISNGEFISQLINYIYTDKNYINVINDNLALIGFSAGGLSTLVATSQDTKVKLWIGLDPVDTNNIGKSIASKINVPTFIIAGAPSSCNAYNNYHDFIKQLPNNTLLQNIGANHTDPEWPTNTLAELICGKSTKNKRVIYHNNVVNILNKYFM